MKPADRRQNICSRYQNDQLTHNGYDHTENSFSKGLENSSCNDAEPCDQIMDAYDVKSRNADSKHIFGCAEQSQESFWYKLKSKEADESKAECDEHADFNSLEHTFSVACAVVVGDDRCDTVIKAEYRHEEKALQLKVNAKYSGCCYCKVHQDQVHGIGHDRADGLHDNRWNTYCVNMSDDLRIRAESMETESDFMIEFVVAESGNDTGYTLSDHCSNSSTCYAHFRSTKKTKDQDRVQDDVCDGTAEL